MNELTSQEMEQASGGLLPLVGVALAVAGKGGHIRGQSAGQSAPLALCSPRTKRLSTTEAMAWGA